ncbi:acyl-CoA dehydrogenase family protein [Streptomyces showdoensis]|uniref:Acyl-CoA dehydrogenase n=1 Tax=Streptomyces showdoensis TaxID=68268 RepID=A0A2P2GTF3_STREW|nr:acyl-CoA dehydrogenase family protein [Streptomyces showdoensis]KKZ74777.1 acyl-CoA dehydrogenase [Streptomyces showdoensis]
MDFRLTEDQRALRRGVRELLDRSFGRDALRAAVERGSLDRELWRELGAAGFFALRLPEEAGGVGLGLPEAVLLFEEAGRALLPGPLIATHLAAGEVPGAAEGAAVVTAVDPSGFVEWLTEADTVRGEAGSAVPVRSVDPLTPLHRVPGAGGARPDPDRPDRADPADWADRADPADPADPAAREAREAQEAQEASLLTAAEQLGSAARTTELAVAHARTREQFGQPIGAFQAVKHLCAQMLVRTELARAAVYAAAVTADPVEIAGARLLADEAATLCARDCLQVHGGMGFTWEADVHLHLKRAWVRAERGLSGAAAEELVAARL